jgi:HAD superfamily hydrolase (TIGR01509 family)
VLFDLDGTLLDSELLWEAAQAQTMEYFGQTWTAQDQAHSIGGPLDRVVAHMARRTGADPGHVARVLVGEIEHRAATQPAHWMPGARELLAQARAAGIPTAIVSNSWRVLLDLLLANVDDPVDVTVSSTEVQRPKPDPQPYLHACELLAADPVGSVVVEDSPTGAAAGLAAGCTVLGVGPAVAHVSAARFRHLDTLEGVELASLSGDGVQDPQP